MTVVTIDEMVKEVLDTANEVEADGKKHWPNDPSMISMCEEDARDLREGASLIKDGDFVDAHKKFSGMDTAARERVPDTAWEYCQQKSEEHYQKLEEAKKPDVEEDEFQCEACKRVCDIEDSIKFQDEYLCTFCGEEALKNRNKELVDNETDSVCERDY